MQDSRALLEQLLQVARISALEEMASGIAHELNQPIGAITTFAQAGQRMLDRPEPMVRPAAEVLQHISHEALNAGEGIRRIRSLFHGHHAERTRCNLADVVAELLPVLELLAARSGATLQFSSPSALPAVAIDRLRIQHVLFTLVQNALEAPTRNGEPPTCASTSRGDRYGVRVAVEDRGMGIPDEARDHLFRPFFTTKAQARAWGSRPAARSPRCTKARWISRTWRAAGPASGSACPLGQRRGDRNMTSPEPRRRRSANRSSTSSMTTTACAAH